MNLVGKPDQVCVTVKDHRIPKFHNPGLLLKVIGPALWIPQAVSDINELTDPINRKTNEDEEIKDNVHREQVKQA